MGNQNRLANRGFTMTEALIALGLLFLGVLGMGAIAGATVQANINASDRTQARLLGEMIISMLQTEAMGWNNPTWNPASNEVPSNAVTTYMPLLSQEFSWAGGFSELTQYLAPVGTAQAFNRDLALVPLTDSTAKYCVHYLLAEPIANEVILAEIRVYWMRSGALPNSCGLGAEAAMGLNSSTVYCETLQVELQRNAGGAP